MALSSESLHSSGNEWHVFAGLVLFAIGCSLLSDVERMQCREDKDCQQPGSPLLRGQCVVGLCEEAENWQCLGDDADAQLTPRAQDGERIVVSLSLVRMDVTADPDASVEVSLCLRADVSCEVPVEHFEQSRQAPVRVSIAPEFEGYLRIGGNELVPTFYLLEPPYARVTSLPNAELISPELLGERFEDLSLDSVQGSGVLKLSSQDCWGRPASGVEYVLQGVSSDTGSFYEIAGQPSLEATRPDAPGEGGFLALPPGLVSVSAVTRSGGPSLGGREIRVRRGSISYAQLGPVTGLTSVTELKGANNGE